MPGKKRPKFKKESDLADVAKLYLQGWSQRVIAAKIGMSQQQVSVDVAELIARWRASAVMDINERKAQELARINELEKTYWVAWQESIGTKTRSTTGKKSGLGESGNMVDLNHAQIVRFEEVGDPRYLAGVERCIELRCKLLGLDAPVKSEVDMTYAIKLPENMPKPIQHASDN